MGLKWMVLALLGLGLGAPALADVYSLSIDHCTGGCGAPPFGTIDVTQAGTDTVQVDVSLAAGDQFVRTGFPGSFAFDLVGNPAISVSDLTAGWSLLSTSAGTLHFDGFGYLEYTLVCNACGHGGSHPFPGQISFDVAAPGLTPANFEELSSGGSAQVNFVADILGTTGRTGPVGATLSSTSVPEPATLGLMSLGLAGATLFRRRRTCPRTVRYPRHHSKS
jgi:PEP-CTERM motif